MEEIRLEMGHTLREFHEDIGRSDEAWNVRGYAVALLLLAHIPVRSSRVLFGILWQLQERSAVDEKRK